MTVIVGIDSMVVVYAGLVPLKRGKASAERRELAVRAKLLFNILKREKAQLVLPTIAIAELLIPVPSGESAALVVVRVKFARSRGVSDRGAGGREIIASVRLDRTDGRRRHRFLCDLPEGHSLGPRRRSPVGIPGEVRGLRRSLATRIDYEFAKQQAADHRLLFAVLCVSCAHRRMERQWERGCEIDVTQLVSPEMLRAMRGEEAGKN